MLSKLSLRYIDRSGYNLFFKEKGKLKLTSIFPKNTKNCMIAPVASSFFISPSLSLASTIFSSASFNFCFSKSRNYNLEIAETTGTFAFRSPYNDYTWNNFCDCKNTRYSSKKYFSFSAYYAKIAGAAALAGSCMYIYSSRDTNKYKYNYNKPKGGKKECIDNGEKKVKTISKFLLSVLERVYQRSNIKKFVSCESLSGSSTFCQNMLKIKENAIKRIEPAKGEGESVIINCGVSGLATSSLQDCSSQGASLSSPCDSVPSPNPTLYQQHHPMWRSEEKRPFERKMDDALIFCGNSNIPLGGAVADRLRTKLGRVQLTRFADGEVSMQFLDSLRGKDIYIIQPTSPPVNEHLMELLLMVSTCRRSSAKKITAVIPYYGYARQDRKLSSRVPISAADVARMIEAMGVDRVVAVDLHCGQIQGFFGPRVPVDNLEAQIVGLEHFTQKKLHKPVIVSPDAGGVYRARKFQEGLIARGVEECNIAMLIKQRVRANEIERMDLVGNVDGSDVIIVDDMIDTAGTLCEAARELRIHGARRVFAFATHGLFSGPAIERIESSALEEVVVTDTIAADDKVRTCNRITTLSISVLLADAIRRIHQKESLNDLFHIRK